ncbi:restriction endonuclease subunit S [Candidatus Roizmanbacteria bacterium]|nr:restriction endonuclease subunit S [Candidatus Roizmanbacteria bacterium]
MSKWQIKKLYNHVIESKETHASSNLNGTTVLSVTNDKGFELSENKTSADLSKYKVVKENYFAYNPYRINVGSIALSRDGQKGIVSPAYVVFYTTEDLDPEYLFLFLKSDVGLFHIRQGGKGSVRSSLSFEKLQEIEMPLPPLQEQKRIVVRIKDIERKIQKAQDVKERASLMVDNLLLSISTKVYDELAKNGTTNLEELTIQITDGTHVTPSYRESGTPFISVKDITSGLIDFSNTRFISEHEHKELTKRCKPEKDDILLTKVGTIGYAKVIDVDKEFSIFVSLALIKTKKDKLLPKFLEYMLNSTRLRQLALEKTRGIGNKNLVLKFIKEFPIPNASLDEQKSVIKKLDATREKTNNLLSEYSLSRKVITAIKPSILAKAFSGKL